MREPLADGLGSLRADISTAIVGLYKKHFGKGPTHCRTYLEPDLVVVILGEGYTVGEGTLFEAGKWYDVRNARQIWQDSMQERFVATIEEEFTERKVKGFLSTPIARIRISPWSSSCSSLRTLRRPSLE